MFKIIIALLVITFVLPFFAIMAFTALDTVGDLLDKAAAWLEERKK